MKAHHSSLLALGLGLLASSTTALAGDLPDLDSSLTDGYGADDLTEVSDGLWLRSDLTSSTMSESEYSAGTAAGEAASAYKRSCYNRDVDAYKDENAHGSLTQLGGTVSWGGSVSAYSYCYYSERGYHEEHAVSATALTQSGAAADYIQTYGYIYVNGDFWGVLSDYATDETFTSISAYLSQSCDDGAIAIELRGYHYASATSQWLSTGNYIGTKIRCCDCLSLSSEEAG